MVALRKAAANPTLFKLLIDKYSNKAIPEPNFFDHILMHDYKIKHYVAIKIAAVSRKSVEFAGIYAKGVIITDVFSVSQVRNDETKDNALDPFLTVKTDESKQAKVQASHTPPHSPSMQKVSLPCGIVLYYPAEIAHLLAFGHFGKEISALDKAVKNAKVDMNKDQVLIVQRASTYWPNKEAKKKQNNILDFICLKVYTICQNKKLIELIYRCLLYFSGYS